MFTPHLKSKRGARKKGKTTPFPPNAEHPYEGIFTGYSVEVLKADEILQLYLNGCYGKGNQSRGAPQVVFSQQSESLDDAKVEESLTLSLEESFFLANYLNVLTVRDLQGEVLDWKEFLREALIVDAQFIEHMAAYLYLKSKGWVIKSGLKYGGHFLLYKREPRLFHASFVVLINRVPNSDHLVSKDLKGLLRIAEAAFKDVLFLDVLMPTNFELSTLSNFNQILVTETIVRRFNQKVFVAQHNKSKRQKINKNQNKLENIL